MGKPIVYGTEISPPNRSVLLVAKAIGLDIELREVNFLLGEQKKPEFIKINPQHTVPTLEDDGFIVWDSHAIATYLIGKYAKDDSLYPKDLCKRAIIDQRLHFNCGILFTRLRAIVERIVYFGESEISIERIAALNEAYEFLEKFLVNDVFLAGNSMTVADLCCIAIISSAQIFLSTDAEKFPKLAAWMKRMEELPYYEEANGKGLRKFNATVKEKQLELSGRKKYEEDYII